MKEAIKKRVLIFGVALGVSHYLVHLMLVGIILSKNRSISRFAASALKFSCFVPYVNISGNGALYSRVVLFVFFF